jgi:hypothetical protein
MFLACQQWIQSNNKLKFLIIWKNAVETSKIAVDSCYVPRQFLTPLPSIDFREIRGLSQAQYPEQYWKKFWSQYKNNLLIFKCGILDFHWLIS